MPEYRIVIPNWRPHTTNELLGTNKPGYRSKMKKQDRAMVLAYCLKAGVSLRHLVMRQVDVRIVQYKGRSLDPDAVWKSLLDALVRCGALWDDGPNWCMVGKCTVERGPALLTEITLTDL